jgi:hypothetical protein
VNIQYADSNGSIAGECYFEPGHSTYQYEKMLKEKVGNGQMYRGPITLMESQKLVAGEYTYLVPGTLLS